MSQKQIYIPITVGAQQYKQEWDDAIKTTNTAKDAIATAAAGASQAAQKQAGAVNTLTKEYRASFAEAQKLVQMGNTHEAAYIQAAKAAGQYKNDLDDTREVIKAFSRDTPVLTASLGAMQGLAGAASVAAGAMGLMGVEGEEVQKVMLKVQSAIAMVQGLQAIGALGDSFKALKVVLIAEVVPALMTVSGAMIATGIGALVVAVAALAMYWSNVADEADRANKVQEEAAETAKKVAELNKKSQNDIIALREMQVRAMKDGKAKEMAEVDLAMKKEIYAARLVAAEHNDQMMYQVRLQQKLTAITDYYAQERAKIEKKYTPEKEKIEVNVERVTSLKESKVTMTLKPQAKIDTSRIKPVDLSNIFRTKKMESEFSQQLKNLATAFSDFGQQLQQSAANIGAGIGYALGSALAGQGNFGDAMKQQLAQLMQQVGTAMIAMGIAYKTTGIGFGYGAMLVGAGIVLNIAAGALAATAGGGGGGSGSGGGGGVSEGFYGATLQREVAQPDLSTKIRGRDLYIVNGRNNSAARRFGGM